LKLKFVNLDVLDVYFELIVVIKFKIRSIFSAEDRKYYHGDTIGTAINGGINSELDLTEAGFFSAKCDNLILLKLDTFKINLLDI